MDFEYLVKEILEKIDDLDEDGVKELQRIFAKEHKMKTLPSKSQIIETYLKMIEQGEIEKNEKFEHLLRKRAIRSLSGIVSVQVLTKPRPCPGKCIFCPNDPTMPKSYIKSEPGAMRAFLNQFDPRKQVYNRLQSLTLTGHQPKKIEMIVLGGSRDAYPQEYKENFIKELYDACNTFSQLKIKMHNSQEDSHGTLFSRIKKSRLYRSFSNLYTKLLHRISPTKAYFQQEKNEKEKKFGFTILNEGEIEYSSTLEEALKKNETAEHRIIGLTIETRPDLVSHRNCQSWRKFGVTRVEMGIQSTNDEVLELNKRGHNLEAIKQALHLLRKYGFKISVHLMPGLYGSDFEKDIQSFRDTFSDPWLKPDELKFYPTSVIPNTELYTLFKEGKYEPLTTDGISHIIKKTFKEIIPPYTRIKRLIRDIPATEIAAGSNVTNLSQLVHDELLKEYQQKIQHSDTKNEVETFYRRIYGEYELFKDEEEYFESNHIPSFSQLIQWEQKSPFDKGEAPQEQGDMYKKNFLAYNPSLLSKAKALRANMTEAETKLRYHFLQPLNIKVLRQKPIDEYIVDFYIASKKLVIEIDGDTHWTDKEIAYDQKRTNRLQQLGLHIIRFTNDEVYHNFEAVCNEINKILNDETLYPPLPPYQKGALYPSVVRTGENNNEQDFPLSSSVQGCPFFTQIIGVQPDVTSFRHFVSLDTRSREVRNKKEKTKNLNLILRTYQSSVGKEIFISYEDELGYLYGFTRLLLPLEEERLDFEGLGKGTSIIRELHVYGELQAVGEKSDSATQHSGLGKKLLKTAENIAKKEGFTAISVISGIGVREYYEKQGFTLEGTYMKKTVD